MLVPFYTILKSVNRDAEDLSEIEVLSYFPSVQGIFLADASAVVAVTEAQGFFTHLDSLLAFLPEYFISFVGIMPTCPSQFLFNVKT